MKTLGGQNGFHNYHRFLLDDGILCVKLVIFILSDADLVIR